MLGLIGSRAKSYGPSVKAGSRVACSLKVCPFLEINISIKAGFDE